jgi:fibronectin-binding autotransporter adhesin
LAVTGNANVGNLNTSRVVATGNISGTQLISNIATGTAPLVVTSTTRVANLNAATAGAADSATNASAVLNNVRSTGTYYPAFISATANGNYALNSNTAIYANLNTGTLYATNFDGNLAVSDINSGTAIIKTGLITNYFGNSTATSGNISFQRFRGNNTVYTEALNGDQIGLINFVAWDGFNLNPAASITSIVDAAYTPGITTSAPGAIVFNTANAAQNGVTTEKMRVTSTGNVGIANTNPGHTLSITGTLNASGNANVGNLGTAGSVTATGTVSGGNLTTGGAVVATGNITGGNLTTGGAVVATGNVSGGNIIASGYHLRSVGTGISANGTTQAQATALTKEMNIVSTVLSTQGVVLPTAVAGMVITITNTSANSLLVYPAVNGIINSQSANAAYSQAPGATLQFIAPTTTQWYTVGATFA